MSYLHGTAHQCAMGGGRSSDGDDLLGAVLGERYRIVSCLSKGGMGVVYRAQHTVLDKPLALKIMLQPQDEGARQRFLQEAKLASLVRHPNIVDIVDFGVLTSQQPYLVMELLVGQTLADAIFQGPMSPTRTCYLVAQVARGLHAVHQKGIIHRDLKPANIFIIKNDPPPGQVVAPGQAVAEVAKVVDFGIATIVNPEADNSPERGPPARLTTPGMVLGTAEYMSPEQAQGLKTDHRVDQYALGCIMYEMLTGRVPFQGTTPAATMLKHLTEKPVPPSRLRPEIPGELEAIVLRAMANDPVNRFPSMQELEQALVAVMTERVRKRSVSSATLQLPKAPPPNRRLQAAVAVGIGILLFNIVFFTVLLGPKPPAQLQKPPEKSALKPAVQKTVKWSVRSDPKGATIVRKSDGKQLGKTPYDEDMPSSSGATAVELRLEGHQPATLELSNTKDDINQRAHLAPLSPIKDKGAKKGGKAKKRNDYRDNDDIPVLK